MRVTKTSNNYVFNYTDHLGNVRLSYTKDPNTNVLTILEENNYYPFGLKHRNYNMTRREYISLVVGDVVITPTNLTIYDYKYNGKEWQDELGLNWTAMDFRNYDMALARFVNPDPMSEQAHNISPYRFGFNTPTLFSDPTGLWEEITGGWSTNESGEIEAFITSIHRRYKEKDDTKKLDIYVNANKADRVLEKSYKQIIYTEKVLTELFGYSTLKTIDLPGNNGIYDWNDLSSSLSELKSNGYSFSSFIFDSHGSYTDTKFFIGSDEVNPGNYFKTSSLSSYLKGTSVYIMACHAAGGKNPNLSEKFIQGLSNLWGATVYGNRSWSPSSIFNKNLKVNDTDIDQPNATKWVGHWLKAIPGQKKPTIIKNLVLRSHNSLNPGIYNEYN